MIVCKFGGTSLASAAQIMKVAAILKSDDRRRAVIVSAPGKRTKSDTKVTDMLYACHTLAARALPFSQQFSQIVERYMSIADELNVPRSLLENAFHEIEQRLFEGAGSDYTASRGEYLSALVVAAYLGWQFLDTADLVVINEDGTVADETYDRIASVTAANAHYVFPGFYGSTPDGTIKTFSRGGSDITGSIVARSMKAELYENWTDVSGVFMADPRILNEAKIIDTMTYREVRELASVGFNVFHEEAIAPVREVGIPIRVKNTNAPNDPGTAIVSSRDSQSVALAGVTIKTGYCRLLVEKLMLTKHSYLRRQVEESLEKMGLHPEFCTYGIDSMIWWFSSSQIADGLLNTIIPLLKQQFSFEQVICETGFAMAAVVGEGLPQKQDALASIWSALRQHAIQCEYIAYGTSRTTLLITVQESQAINTVKTLYEALFK
ncbi:MAG: aspartate kinase [Sphaerochaetaceae bacterium]|jgi:aspartate kinase|nr:aspartate kinase [Sphaerochaetaceae bacterium]MDX9810185.1 aspartate kinase [Sphaerochaetaceae bacterium]NLV83611.1 aspartate kinase [Spirochaetales bacterium]